MLFTAHVQGAEVGVILDHFEFMISNLKKDLILTFILTDHLLTIKTNCL